MRVLGLTTSSAQGSVALIEPGLPECRAGYQGLMVHAERLFGVLDELLTRRGLDRAEIELVACDVGPGSFTGIRAGLAAAKGIAMALGIPVVPVLSLEAVAAAAWSVLSPETAVRQVACVLDAQRQESFYAVYDRSLDPVVAPAHTRSDKLLGSLGSLAEASDLCFVGDQARRLGLDPARTIRDTARWPDAVWVAHRGLAVFQQTPPAELDEIEPVYLRPPDATPPR